MKLTEEQWVALNNKAPQTAVDYLFEKLWDTDKDKLTWHKILEQAKQMEKVQIMHAHYMGFVNKDNHEYFQEDDHFYNEMYKKNTLLKNLQIKK